jgi:hypothetical protein
LLLVADFDARQGYAKWGFGTTAQWVAHYCGLSRRTAIERVRVARALADHPGLAEEMGAGQLSYSHVRAISRVAGIAEPGLVDDLVMLAEHGSVGQLEAAVRGLRTVDTLARPAAPSGESLSQGWGEDSRWRCAARLDPREW